MLGSHSRTEPNPQPKWALSVKTLITFQNDPPLNTATLYALGLNMRSGEAGDTDHGKGVLLTLLASASLFQDIKRLVTAVVPSQLDTSEPSLEFTNLCEIRKPHHEALSLTHISVSRGHSEPITRLPSWQCELPL